MGHMNPVVGLTGGDVTGNAIFRMRMYFCHRDVTAYHFSTQRFDKKTQGVLLLLDTNTQETTILKPFFQTRSNCLQVCSLGSGSSMRARRSDIWRDLRVDPPESYISILDPGTSSTGLFWFKSDLYPKVRNNP